MVTDAGFYCFHKNYWDEFHIFFSVSICFIDMTLT